MHNHYDITNTTRIVFLIILQSRPLTETGKINLLSVRNEKYNNKYFSFYFEEK